MQLISGLLGLFALHAGATAIAYRQDPVLFTYGTWQNQTCSTLPSDIREFHQSDLSLSGCMAWKDFLGNDEPAVAVFVLETPTNGECQGTYPSSTIHLPTYLCNSCIPYAVNLLINLFFSGNVFRR